MKASAASVAASLMLKADASTTYSKTITYEKLALKPRVITVVGNCNVSYALRVDGTDVKDSLASKAPFLQIPFSPGALRAQVCFSMARTSPRA